MAALIENGKALYRVVIAENASQPERFAAGEMIAYVYKMTGVSMNLVTDAVPAVAGEIAVGRTNRAAAREDLAHDGFAICHKDGLCTIQGTNDRGTVFGVYALLEEVLGCRFFATGVENVPRRKNLSLPELDLRQIPPLEYRENGFMETFDADWAAKTRQNGNVHDLKAQQGKSIKYFPFVHTFNGLVPPEKYFDTHPEYYSMIDGKRIKERTQLCLSNPEVLAIAKKQVRRWIVDHPEATIISVSQNDCGNPCDCPECRKILEEEGAQSGALIRFVNAIAADIAEDYPHIAIDTLAYTYTRSAPKLVKPLPNVIVRLCSIECCFSHPLAENCKESYVMLDRKDTKTFQQDLADWGKICGRIYIWDYVTNYAHYLMPFPNFQVLEPNMQFFVENGVVGVYEEACYQTLHAEMAAARSYVLAKVMWDPYCDDDKVLREFAVGYYGMAASSILSYIRLLKNKVVDEHIHMGIYDPPTTAYLSADVLEKANALFDQAEAVADNEEILRRVQATRLELDYVKVATMPKDDPDYEKAVDAFLTKAECFGVTLIHECWALPSEYGRLTPDTPYRPVENSWMLHHGRERLLKNRNW